MRVALDQHRGLLKSRGLQEGDVLVPYRPKFGRVQHFQSGRICELALAFDVEEIRTRVGLVLREFLCCVCYRTKIIEGLECNLSFGGRNRIPGIDDYGWRKIKRSSKVIMDLHFFLKIKIRDSLSHSLEFVRGVDGITNLGNTIINNEIRFHGN